VNKNEKGGKVGEVAGFLAITFNARKRRKSKIPATFSTQF